MECASLESLLGLRTISAAGWFELTGPWRVSGANSLFISGGQAFDRTKGRFTAPAIGTYWVVANVMLTGR